MCKLQGIRPKRLANVDSNLLFGKCIGNGMSIKVISKIIADALQCTNLISQRIHQPFTRMTKIIKHLSNKGRNFRRYPNSDHGLWVGWGVQHSRGAAAYLSLSTDFLVQIVSQQHPLLDRLVVPPMQVIKGLMGFTTDPPRDDGATTPSQLVTADKWKLVEKSSRNQMLYQASKSIDDKEQVKGPPIKKEIAQFRDSCLSKLAKEAIYEVFQQADRSTVTKIVQQSQSCANEKDKRE